MTAKRKGGRGLLARLEDLEAKEAARLEDVRAKAWGQIERAEGQLSPADRKAWKDAARVCEHGEDPEALARMVKACAHLPADLPVTHPAKAEAEAWEPFPEGEDVGPLRPAPAGRVEDFAAYFEACARWNDSEARRVPLSADVHRLARWGAALYRFEANLCRVLGGQT